MSDNHTNAPSVRAWSSLLPKPPDSRQKYESTVGPATPARDPTGEDDDDADDADAASAGSSTPTVTSST
jgi:hypothetical protein